MAPPAKKKKAATAPAWFQHFVDDEQKRTDDWRAEIRSHFARMEDIQQQRLDLIREAVRKNEI